MYSTMTSVNGDYYICIIYQHLSNCYKIISSGDHIPYISDKVICAFNVGTKKMAKLVLYLFNQKYPKLPSCDSSTYKRTTNDMCTKMQKCIYKAQNITDYMAQDGGI